MRGRETDLGIIPNRGRYRLIALSSLRRTTETGFMQRRDSTQRPAKLSCPVLPEVVPRVRLIDRLDHAAGSW
jgi:hypothetical protein